MKLSKIISASMAGLLLILTLAGCGGGKEPGISHIDWNNQNMRAQQFVTALTNGDYTVATAGFNAAMSQAMDARGLKQAWEDTVKTAGTFISIISTETIPHDEYDIYHVVSRHKYIGVNTRIVFSADGLVAGLFFSFVENDDWDMSPVSKDGYTEIPIIIGDGTDYPLRGLVSMPDSTSGKVPAVVLVHGSGPQDMNETAFGITVFQDIAAYLAQNGVAVLRYNKRTYSHGEKLAAQYGDDLTVREETIDDASLAKAILAQDERIDQDRIFVLGHSLGGMLTPRMVREGDFAGGIIMAGSPRSLLDIIYDQNLYFIGLMDLSDDALGELLELVDEARAALFTLPEQYIREMDGHPAANYLMGTNKPFLIMQGGKDFQVYADVDFMLYKELVGERPNFDLRLYDELGHLFTRSTMDNPTTDDYVAGTPVDLAPLADIVDWIQEKP